MCNYRIREKLWKRIRFLKPWEVYEFCCESFVIVCEFQIIMPVNLNVFYSFRSFLTFELLDQNNFRKMFEAILLVIIFSVNNSRTTEHYQSLVSFK